MRDQVAILRISPPCLTLGSPLNTGLRPTLLRKSEAETAHRARVRTVPCSASLCARELSHLEPVAITREGRKQQAKPSSEEAVLASQDQVSALQSLNLSGLLVL